MAPGDRVAQRSLALWRVTPAPDQERQALREAGQHGSRREERAPRSGQFDRQRQAVQPVADGRHRPGVLIRKREPGVGRPRPVDEEPNRGDPGQLVRRWQPVRVGHRQRGHRHNAFAGEPQRGPAGGQNRQARAPAQEIGGQRRRVEQVLEIVENQQQVAVAQRITQTVGKRAVACLDQPEGAGDRGGDEGRVADSSEGNETRRRG